MSKIDADFQWFLRGLPVKGGARTRITNVLRAEGIDGFDALLSKTDLDLLRLPFMGRVFVTVLRTALADRGLSLAANHLAQRGEEAADE